MLRAEHPASQHRNLIGLQRLAVIRLMNLKVDELYAEGYPVDADRVLDMLTELRVMWDNESD